MRRGSAWGGVPRLSSAWLVAAWRGAAWRSTAWHGTVRHGMTRHGMTRRHGAARRGGRGWLRRVAARCGAAPALVGSVGVGFAWNGAPWRGVVRPGSARHGSAFALTTTSRAPPPHRRPCTRRTVALFPELRGSRRERFHSRWVLVRCVVDVLARKGRARKFIVKPVKLPS